MEDLNYWLDLIQFFDNIEVEEKVIEENKEEGSLVMKVTYKLKNEGKEYTTPELYYKDISKIGNVEDPKVLVRDPNKIIKFFEKSVYWLDTYKHKWPASRTHDIENIEQHVKDNVIGEISGGNKEFKEFLEKLYEKLLSVSKLQDGQYGHKLITNNHWHDIVKLIKYFIEKKGVVNLDDDKDEESYNEAKKYFERLVFDYLDSGRVSLHPFFGSRRGTRIMLPRLLRKIYITMITMMIKEIKKMLEYKKQIIL